MFILLARPKCLVLGALSPQAFRMALPSALHEEIHEQPHTLARLLGEHRQEVLCAAARISAFRPEWVVIAARGTSDNAARYAQYLFGAHNQLGVALAVPSLFTLYNAPPRLNRALTIGISQSGQSPDVVAVVDEARRQGGETLAITTDPASPLGRAAASCIPLATGKERAVAATKTYTNELLALAMLSAALSDDDDHWAALETVPGAVEVALASTQGLAEIAATFREATRFLVLGRGFNYSTAFEVALKMKETSYVLAEPYSVADLLHGPVAMIERGFPVILIAPSGRASDHALELSGLLEQRKARVIAFSDRTDVLERAEGKIRLPRGVPEWLSPLVSIVPGQLWARSLAMAKGLDPDAPRGLSKVTLTR
jgi:glucosamine--fructose-6-phosphate aminotransferase (isomerizing)